MYSKFVKFCSVILTVTLLINLLPVQVLGEEFKAILAQPENVSSNVAYDNELDAPSNATIIGESVDKRTEFSKEYKLSNGLNMVVVYPEAVHIQKDNAWEEIDNTLVADNSRSVGTYRNKNNSWNVSLPQQLSATNKVTVEKDGYVVSFGMAGEKRRYIGQVETELLASASGNIVAVTDAARTTSAQIVDLNYEEVKSMSAHPETVADTLQSRVQYSNVYQNTDVQYDLNSYQLKESIILRSYNPAVRGYDFLLETDDLIPVLQEDDSILLQTAQGETVMTLPAPYMIDNNGAISKDVGVTLTPSKNGYLLSYQMPTEWLADANRAWPVVLDPVIVFEMYRQNLKDHFVAEDYYEDYNHGVMYCGYYQYYGKMRSFLRYVNIPDLTSADVIVNATLSLYRNGGSVDPMPVEAHKVLGNWDSQTITWSNQPGYNPTIEDYSQVGGTGRYSWEITDIVRDWYEGGSLENNTGVMLKAPDSVENSTTNFWKKFYTIDYDITNPSVCPQMYIYFKNNNGIEGYWDYTSNSAGRAGTGYVNNYSGNLTWVHNDIGFGGNRMPVSISHVYNTNDSTKNTYGLGYGWRTNFNQTVGLWDKDNSYYFWEDGDGTIHYFKHETGSTYKDEDGLDLTLTVSGGAVTITDKNGSKSFFDTQGRLYKIENNQATKSNISITYLNATSKMISKITDGVGRAYNFTYTGDLLSKISYVGKGTTELSYVTFGYTGSNLTSVTDKDGESSLYTYSGNYLTSAQNVDGYKLQYSYCTGLPKRVVRISEYDGTIAGGYMNIEYAHNQTTITDHNDSIQILQFNDWGNLLTVQDDQGRAQYVQYARNNYDEEDTSKANQMRLSSKMQNTVCNRTLNGDFEQNVPWDPNSSTITASRSTETSYLGDYSLKVMGTVTAPRYGAYSRAIPIAPGDTICVSAYIKTVDATVTLGIERQPDFSAYDSEIIPAGKDWERYELTYTNNTGSTHTIRCFLYIKEPGTAYIDCVQAENEFTASRYNLVDNGTFEHMNYGWSSSGMSSEDTYVNVASPVSEQDGRAFRITGSPTTEKYLSQRLNISGSAGDNYVLSGWAKGDSVPLYNEDRTYGLSLTFHNQDGSSTTKAVSFNPACDSMVNWQYVATAAVADKDYTAITVKVEYSNNANTVYFDGIQLFKETFGTSYTYDDDGNVKSVVDLQNETTTYEYDTNSNLTKILQGNKAKMRYEYDDYHNVTKAITQTEDDNGNIVDGVVYEFAYDAYGNNTSVKIVNGNMSISSSATYTSDGNRLLTTKDDLENVTTYCYNENTNVLEWVQNPNDTEATRTNYTYDDLYRMATASMAVPGLSEGTALTASYTYEDDQLTEIQTASTTYELYYGDFGVPTGVSIGDRWLAIYEYSEDANRYLDAIEYGNRQINIFDYDSEGRLIRERFDDGSKVTYTYDNTGALSTMTDSATGRKTTYYYDLIDRLGKYKEVGSNFEHSVAYTYDERNNLSKLVESINGAEHTTNYTYDHENRLTGTTYNDLVAGNDVTEEVEYDEYGRLYVTRLKNNGSTVLGSWFQYAYGNSTYADTTRLGRVEVSTPTGYILSSSYDYDDNGNITSYNVSGGSDIEWWSLNTDTPVRMGPSDYHYDTANQLVREDNAWLGKTFVWTYDNAGNITSRKEYTYTDNWEEITGTPIATDTYTYGDSTWGDLLTAYNGVPRTYDEIGNLLTDGTWTYTWQNGRELASMSNGTTTWNYTYDGNGMRTSRTNGTKTYNYVYNGSQLTQMTVGSDTLYFTYGALGPTTVSWNGTTYYYALNGQGDVTGIFDSAGDCVVFYNWDNAWGYNPAPEGSLASTLGALNPLRYRGYVYDAETGFYYVSSRYYDPEIGRFINADAAIGQIGNVQGTNMFAYCFNNPVNMSDPTGNWPKLSTIFTVVAVAAVAVAAVAVTVATCGAAAPALAVAGGGIIGGISAGAAATAASVATGAMIVAGVSTAAAVTSVVAEKAVEKTAKRNNSVYVLKDDAGTVQYVGRTNNVDKRRAAHSANPARAGLEMEVIASGLNLPESRALEQAGMAYYHTINTANKMNNQINSVSPKYWGAFKELALGTLNYGWNQMSNEILYWTGN